MRKIVLLSTLIVLAGHRSSIPTNAQRSTVVFGQIVKSNNSPPVYNEGLVVYAENNGKLISGCEADGQQCVSDIHGYFAMNVKYDKDQSYDVFVNTLSIRRLYLGSFTPNGDSLHLRLTIPATFEKDKNGYAVCPKCHRSDKTFRLIYTSTLQDLGPREMLAGGTLTPSEYFCKRDQINF